MISRLDHVVILVEDLSRAVADFTECGFRVTPGGLHAAGTTHNALVPFADGSYFELIAFIRRDPRHRWWHHVATGPGIIDFALLPSDPAADIMDVRGRGIELSGPVAGGRVRPDGVRLEWVMGIPTDPVLPFLCGDVTPRSLRVPGGEATAHPNGAKGIGEVAVVTSRLEATANLYARLLDVDAPAAERDDQLGTRLCRFTIGGTGIVIMELAPAADKRVVDAYRQSGEGPCAAILVNPATRGVVQLDSSLTSGAWIEMYAPDR
jgi:catechol 2,3-dioxygenase-like lactoylglutathione lyase family enzyme